MSVCLSSSLSENILTASSFSLRGGSCAEIFSIMPSMAVVTDVEGYFSYTNFTNTAQSSAQETEKDLRVLLLASQKNKNKTNQKQPTLATKQCEG
jgi:hypothetical protein